MIGVVPFEASRISIYASSILILLTIWSAVRQTRPTANWNAMLVGLGIGYLFILSSQAPLITLFWLVQVVMIAAWIWSLHAIKIPLKDILVWFVLSLIPHALLAIDQFIRQEVLGTKWLGIAAQDPMTPGVSVVLGDPYSIFHIPSTTTRILRAYGGLPHPNILGGWMAVGSMATLSLAMMTEQSKHRYLWVGLGGICLLALVLTFSRSAWLMLAIGLVGIACVHKKRKLISVFAGLFILTLCATAPVWTSRVTVVNRLETKSIDERSLTYGASIQAIQSKSLLGYGLATAPLALQAVLGQLPAPLYPHNLPLMVLLEAGMFGLGLALYLLWQLRRSVENWFWLAMILPVVLLDHYLWSFWPGQLLFGLIILFSLQKKATFGDLTQAPTIGQSMHTD